jgi:hypothetical protein
MHLQRACGSAVVLVVALLVPPCSGDAPATAPAPPLGRPLRKAALRRASAPARYLDRGRL